MSDILDNTPSYKIKKKSKNHKLIVLVGLCLAVVAVLAYAFWQFYKPSVIISTDTPATTLDAKATQNPPKQQIVLLKSQQLIIKPPAAQLAQKSTPKNPKNSSTTKPNSTYPVNFPKDKLETMPNSLNANAQSYGNYGANYDNAMLEDAEEESTNAPLREAIDRAKILNDKKIAKALPHATQNKKQDSTSNNDLSNANDSLQKEDTAQENLSSKTD